jgi:cell division septation protein DedD
VAYLRNEQDSDLKQLGVAFDNFYLESSLYTDGRVQKAVDAMVQAGFTYEADGALWLRTTDEAFKDFKDDKDRVMRKKDGYYTYFVPDVAYHLAKFERGFDRAINIQGSDHHGTVARVRIGLQAASKTLGISIPKTFPEYLLHKMLLVVKDGQEVKMSKRAGTYVTLRDLVDWVGRDAARFFLVSRKSDAEFVFDINLACSKSDENPVYYLQYAHARICSVLRQAQEKGFAIPAEAEAAEFDLSSLTGTAATALAAKFAGYGETLAVAARDLAPHLICVYLNLPPTSTRSTTPNACSSTTKLNATHAWPCVWRPAASLPTVWKFSAYPLPNVCKENGTKMTIRKYSGAALFWSFTMGVVTALILAAAVFIFISNAPIPFVNKIQQVSTSVDEKLLDGKTIDPNKKLYASGQGSEQTESQVASVTAGNTDAAEVVATDRYWVNAGTFSELPDAEKVRGQIAFTGNDAQIEYRREAGKRVYRVRLGPFDNETAAEEIRQTLADNGIQGTVMHQPN